MAVAVCVVVFLLAVAACGFAPWREAVLAGAAGYGGFVVALTEGLGAAHQLRYGPVLACWIAAGLGLVAIVWANRANLVAYSRPRLDPCDYLLLAVLAVLVVATGLIAVRCPPNNWDVALYHLPRQLQWLQQASVEHFPTQDYRLTVNPPFAEFVGLHLLLLSGTDRFTTVESWAAMVLSLIAVSLVARELGLGRKGQLLAAVFAATIPVGFHEAANGKNDWLVALWLAAVMFWTLRVWSAARIAPGPAVFAGLSLGLLLLTKGTGAIYAAPLVLLGGLALVVRRPAGWLPAAAIIGLLTVALNAGHWQRNHAAYGNVSGQTFGLANERHDPAALTSGLVRNVAMHLAGPRESWNRKLDRAVHRVHDRLGVGIEDPETTWFASPFRIADRRHEEDFAQAPVHVLLLLVALPIVALRGGQLWAVFLFAALAGFVLFCAVFKWQPWHTRLHLPCLALLGVAFARAFTLPGLRWLAPVAVAALLWSVIPAATLSEARSLGSTGLSVFHSDSDRLRFNGQDAIAADAREVVARVAALHPARVDLINHAPLPWEYPVALWLRSGESPPRIGYFYPVNGSPADDTVADVVIDVGSPEPPRWVKHPRSRAVYRLTARIGTFSIYRPAGPDAPPVGDQPVGRFGIGTEWPDPTP